MFDLANAPPQGLPGSASALESSDARFLSYEQECYLLLPPASARRAGALSKAILHAHTAWHTIAFLTSLKHMAMPSTLSSIGLDVLDMLVEGIEAVIVGAYDGEGYLVWTRTHGDR